MCVNWKGAGGVTKDKNIKEAQDFLSKARELIRQNKVSINMQPWSGGRVNKTLAYMTETGITLEDICGVILELEVSNYSYKEEDRNERFKGEEIWVFGIAKNLIDEKTDYYIKLKIRKLQDEQLIIMSFHPERPTEKNKKLKFPYKAE